MAFIKYGSAVITRPVVSLQKWAQIKTAHVTQQPTTYIDLADYPVDRFLFSQATIMGAAEVEPNGYYIKKGYEQMVNMNGDCWPTQVVLDTHHTYRGAYNFLEHVQIPEQSKGTILDSLVKRATMTNGQPALFVDILVATDRKHHDLCRDIAENRMNTMSLGAIVKYSRCSRCGREVRSGSDYCDHLRNERRGVFTDENGYRRIIAEVCGREGDISSNTFIEGSWVAIPAYAGAVKRAVLFPSEEYGDPATTASLLKVGKKRKIESTEESMLSQLWY